MKECTKCKSNEYTNKSLVMLINECAHPLCRNCVDNLYARNSAPCHICGRVLKKNTFWTQVFDDPQIEKENHIRKRLRKIFNLKEEDFPTLRDYNDYLEEFETYVFNLANDVNAEETEAVVKEFAGVNADLIDKNRKRLDDDQMWVRDQLKEEEESKRRIAQSHAADAEAASSKKSAHVDHKAIIDELKNSQAPAEQILDRERKKQIEAEMEQKEEAERKKKLQKVETRKRAADQVSFKRHGRGDETRGHVYCPPDIVINGPEPPAIEDLEALGYLAHMRASRPDALAGGFVAQLGAARALIEARVDLLAF